MINIHTHTHINTYIHTYTNIHTYTYVNVDGHTMEETLEGELIQQRLVPLRQNIGFLSYLESTQSQTSYRAQESFALGSIRWDIYIPIVALL